MLSISKDKDSSERSRASFKLSSIYFGLILNIKEVEKMKQQTLIGIICLLGVGLIGSYFLYSNQLKEYKTSEASAVKKYENLKEESAIEVSSLENYIQEHTIDKLDSVEKDTTLIQNFLSVVFDYSFEGTQDRLLKIKEYVSDDIFLEFSPENGEGTSEFTNQEIAVSISNIKVYSSNEQTYLATYLLTYSSEAEEDFSITNAAFLTIENEKITSWQTQALTQGSE